MALDPGAVDEVGAWLGAQADRVIETHIARVFLIGEHAYKLKKAVDLGYLDFSTPAKRDAVLRRELEMNRATAPDIYQAVRTVTRQAGGLAFDGGGAPLESVLQMRRFDPDGVLSNHPAAVTGDFAEGLGRQVAAFHAEAPPRPEGGGQEAVRFVMESNAEHLRRLPDIAGPLAEAVIARTEAGLAELAPLLDARRAGGFARRCHGDLHLANIVALEGRPVLFDCIEFSDRLSDIDVLYDLAFLLMDLAFRGQPEGAARVLNGYLDEAARTEGDEMWRGLAALPLFLSMRAAVRAHVSAQMGQGGLGRAYLQAALAHLQPASPRLFAVGGLSGTGKSTVARALAARFGPGAVILRSDEIRKRLWGAAPTERLPPEAYAKGQSDRVYGRMMQEARLCLQAGRAVVLDAVFLRPSERDAAEGLAGDLGAAFVGTWLEAPAEVLRRRVSARVGDASDAGERVLDGQLALDAGPVSWRRLDASGDSGQTAASILD